MQSIRIEILAVALMGVLTIQGCGGGASDMPDLGQVAGKVTLDGTALPEATISFIPDEGRTSTAVTNESGEYHLKYTATENGAKIGPHKVTIKTAKAAEDPDNPTSAVPEKLPAKYNSESTLSADVDAGSNTIDFELESK